MPVPSPIETDMAEPNVPGGMSNAQVVRLLDKVLLSDDGFRLRQTWQVNRHSPNGPHSLSTKNFDISAELQADGVDFSVYESVSDSPEPVLRAKVDSESPPNQAVRELLALKVKTLVMIIGNSSPQTYL